MKEDFENLFLSKKEKERRRAEKFNQEKQELEDRKPKMHKKRTDNFDTLVKIVNIYSFLGEI